MIWLIGLFGGAGAVARFVVDGAIQARHRSPWPLGTLTVNVLGSFLLGIVSGWAHAGGPAAALALVGTGFCGGFTTFSTASVEVVRLRAADRPGTAVAYGALTLVCCCAAAAVGRWLA